MMNGFCCAEKLGILAQQKVVLLKGRFCCGFVVVFVIEISKIKTKIVFVSEVRHYPGTNLREVIRFLNSDPPVRVGSRKR